MTTLPIMCTVRITTTYYGGTDMADILEAECATGADAEAMATGCHYNYVTQSWVDGHDHAHYLSDSAPLVFCGADLATCNADGLATERFVASQS